MHIRNMPAEQRPMEKLLFSGASALTNAELLALLIRSGTRDKSAVALAEEVLAFSSAETGGLGQADPRELMRINGIGQTKACAIAASIELVKRLMSEKLRDNSAKLECPDDVACIVKQDMMYERREIFMALFLNSKLKVESKKVISIGSLDSAPVHPREVFGPAVRRGASAVIVAHNHPSGDPNPSTEDIMVTKRLIAASEIIGINLLDHVIIGNSDCISMKAEGYMR